MTKEIEIPEGYEARIEGNKVIIEQKEFDDERIRKRIILRLQYDLERNPNEFTKKEIPEEIAYLEKQKESYSPLCNTVKDKIREYIANHFIADTVVKTDMKSIVKAMEEGVRLGKEEQKPTEWSEEDKTNGWTGVDLERYLSCLQRLGTGNPQQPETINSKWFKEHCLFQPHWKPSEEQIKALGKVAYRMGNACFGKDWANDENLHSLYVALKKLM